MYMPPNIIGYKINGSIARPFRWTTTAVTGYISGVIGHRTEYINATFFGGTMIIDAFDVSGVSQLPSDNQNHILYEMDNGIKVFGRHNGDYIGAGWIFSDNYDYFGIAGQNMYDSKKFRDHVYMFLMHDPEAETNRTLTGMLFWNTGDTDAFFAVDAFRNGPVGDQDKWYNEILSESITSYDPYVNADPIDEGEGGYGEFDYSSDDDAIPLLPTISVTSAGFINLFKMDQQTIADLADYLWSGLFDINTYLKLFGDPMECILSLGIVPVTPAASTSPLYIVVGNHATTIQAPRITSQFCELDCGSIEVKGTKYSNSFMDYSPYTSAQLYLPYVGTVNLDVDEIMDSTIHIVYHMDLLSGSCVAYVEVSKKYNYKGASHTHTNVLYQFSGNILTNIPITSQNFTQILQAVIGAVATGVAGAGAGAGVAAGSGEAAGAMTADQAAAAVGATAQMKAPVARSGNCSSACGLLGTQKPKLMLTLPKMAYAEDMNKERGYPTYMRKTLSALSGTGFCKVEIAHLKGIPCTDTERDEIIRLLESGVEL